MYKLEAVIRPEILEKVRIALEEHGFYGMTITEVKGRGRQKGVKLQGRAGEYIVDFIDKIKLELIVGEDNIEGLIDLICKTAVTGNVGDGKIFICPVKDIIRIRTRERGRNAI